MLTALVTLVVAIALRSNRSDDPAQGDGSWPQDHAAGLDSPPDARDVAPYLSPEDTILTALPGDVEEQDLVIQARESFYDAARRIGGGHRDIMALVTACKPYKNLERVISGDAFRVAVDTTGTVHRLRFDLQDNESYVVLERGEDRDYTVYPLTHPVTHRTCVVSGEVQESLFLSLQACGAPTVLAAKINDIIGWDVDFRRDVRSGDTFRILYEEVRRDGEYLRSGPIIALEYVNQGQSYKGYRFEHDDGLVGYYDEEGRNLEKQLMRAPLEYSRISSGFTTRRFHPIHKVYRPHYGIDYAAPIGTPVYAAGSGTVMAAHYKGGNGRYIRIQHTNRSYETYYLHLHRYAKGVRKGVKVRQGQVIGYVGSSGDSTGPHLDYRVKVDGRWKNPRRLKLPASEPVAAEHMAGFLSTIARYNTGLFSTPQDSGLVVVELEQASAPQGVDLAGEGGAVAVSSVSARENSGP